MREGKKQEIDTTILWVTEEFSRGDIEILIGTRGILWEGWDCPRVNTLIDVTGVSAYMSVNQIHGRAIRLDLTNPKKVANIYDIVCLGDGYQWLRDFERLSKKHNQFYWVDESGLIIKELDHIYPQLERNLEKSNDINTYTLKKSELRDMVYDLWWIWWDFRNEEIFSLSLNITTPYSFIPTPATISPREYLKLRWGNWKSENLLEFWLSSYHTLVRIWIHELIDGAIRVLKFEWKIDNDFSYNLHHSKSGNITITTNSQYILQGKECIEILLELFWPLTEAKYKYTQSNAVKDLDYSFYTDITNNPFFALMLLIWVGMVFLSFIITFIIGDMFYFLLCLVIIIPLFVFYKKITKGRIEFIEKIKQEDKDCADHLSIGMPSIIASNEWKRRIFTGEMPKNFFHIYNPLERYKKILISIISVLYLIQYSYIIEWIFNDFALIVFFIILSYVSGLISYHIINSIFTFCINLPRKLRYRNIKRMNGDIFPVETKDVGSQKFITAKIEKLWI